MDTDRSVNDVLIRFCAAFLDQGFSPWVLPDRELGFYRSFSACTGRGAGRPTAGCTAWPAELARLESSSLGPLESILESLELLGVPEAEWEEFITATLLALRGWAGMIQQMEVRGDRVAHPAPAGSLVGFLAVRLVLERLALAHAGRGSAGLHRTAVAAARRGPRAASRRTSRWGPISGPSWSSSWPRFSAGLPATCTTSTRPSWATLLEEIESFGNLDRRRVFHDAYERRYRSADAPGPGGPRRPSRPRRVADPRFQVICCIDEREESFRRHVEEVAPGRRNVQRGGVFQRGNVLSRRGGRPLHPAVPDRHPAPALRRGRRGRTRWRRSTAGGRWRGARSGTASHQVHLGSRTVRRRGR